MLQHNQYVFGAGDSQLLRNVLNEVLNGFAVENLDALIGIPRSELEELLTHLNELPDAAEVELNLVQTQAFRNALSETLKELGIEEFHTRTGFDFEKGEEVLKGLDGLVRPVDWGSDD
jgi:hypothetical protein